MSISAEYLYPSHTKRRKIIPEPLAGYPAYLASLSDIDTRPVAPDSAASLSDAPYMPPPNKLSSSPSSKF